MFTLNQYQRCFRALANRQRLRLIQELKEHGPQSVTNLAQAISLSVKSTHKHLVTLSQSGFLENERTKNFVLYRLEPQSSTPAPLLSKLINQRS